METVGERITRFREEKGLKQGALAAKIGITRAALSLIETGDTKNPAAATLLKISAVLGRSPYEVLFGETEALKYPEHIRNAEPTLSASEPVATYATHGTKMAVPPELEPIISDMLHAWNTHTISPASLHAWHQLIRSTAQMGDLPPPKQTKGPGITKNISKLLPTDDTSH